MSRQDVEHYNYVLAINSLLSYSIIQEYTPDLLCLPWKWPVPGASLGVRSYKCAICELYFSSKQKFECLYQEFQHHVPMAATIVNLCVLQSLAPKSASWIILFS